jgi:hypothetical protein
MDFYYNTFQKIRYGNYANYYSDLDPTGSATLVLTNPAKNIIAVHFRYK